MSARRRRQRGFSLIELSVAVAIAIFLMAGLLTILQNVRRTQTNQTLLAQLHDNQRLAMTLISDVVQAAGYFPDPTANTLTGALPAITISGTNVAAGQALYGTYNAADPGDTLTVRFTTASSDTIINCIGGTNTSGANVAYVNTFSVIGGQLSCSLNGAAAASVIGGLTRMDVRYGVKRNLAVDDNNVDTYLQANQMTAADWSNVSSLKVRLTFNNPLAGQGGQPATIRFTRVIAVMARAGVKT
jgi:type IV pilus assembly protein PilW